MQPVSRRGTKYVVACAGAIAAVALLLLLFRGLGSGDADSNLPSNALREIATKAVPQDQRRRHHTADVQPPTTPPVKVESPPEAPDADAPRVPERAETAVSRSVAVDLRLVAGDGAPIANSKFGFRSKGREFDGTTDDQGRASVTDVPPSTTTVWIERGHVQWWIEHVRIEAEERASLKLQLGADHMHGRVIDAATRAPVSEADVRVAGPILGETQTYGEGRFEFTEALPGTYRMTATYDGIKFGARAVSVTVPSDDEIVLELRRTGRVAVRFASAEREKLKRAKIELHDDLGEEFAFREESSSGEDLAAYGLIVGRYEVKVSLAGRTHSYPIDVPESATALVEVEVP
jgi:hypothetical protein